MSLRTEIIRVINELVIFGKKISGLPAGSTLDGGELLEAVQGGTNVKITAQQLADLAAAGGSLPDGMVIIIDYAYDITGGALPSTGGTGPGGVIKKGNAVITSGTSSSFPAIPDKSMLVANKDLPSTTDISDWTPLYTIN